MAFRTARFGLLRCPGCGAHRIDPPPIRSDRESQDFYSTYYAEAGDGRQALNGLETREPSGFRKVAEQHPELWRPGSRAADIGCGDGHLCEELRLAGWSEVIGIEVSKTRVRFARERYPAIEFHDRPLPETGIAKASLDLIVMDSVIEHLPDPVGMLRGLRPYLKPEGTLLLLTPNMESGHFRLLGRRWTGMLAPHAHIFLFQGGSLAQLLARGGFSVKDYGSYDARPYSMGEWLRRAGSGDVKGAVWRAHQELGGYYGRAIGQGPMLYGIAGL